jgi:hypothetical protein
LELRPGFAEAHTNLGLALVDQGAIEEAVVCYRRSLEIAPGSAEAHNNLAVAYRRQAELDAAVSAARRALEIRPAYAEAHNNLGIFLLHLGRYEEGWREFEHRLQCATSPRHFSKPRGQGERVEGRTLLIHWEQGYGDALQFARYAPLVRERSGAERVILETHPGMARLLAQSSGWNAEIVSNLADDETRLPPFDCQVPLMSLPLALGIFEPLPMTAAYVHADPELRQEWRQRLGDSSRKRVGLVWAGSTEHKGDRLRSIPPEKLRPLTQIQGLEIYSLQIGPTAVDTQRLRAAGLIDLTEHIHDFADTAALVAELDLVISVDTAVAHLAGAMGREVWTLLPFPSDWRWGLSSDTTPWYPTMRLFRQPHPGDWDAVVESGAKELKRNAKQPA